MLRLSLVLLGFFQARLDGQAIDRFESNKVRALLAYLAVENGRVHSRDELAGLLWPEQPDRAARNNLRQALANLRQAIGDRTARPPFLHITRRAIQFNTRSDHEIDLSQFKELLSACDAHHHRHAGRCRSCARRRQQAVALYGGDFLAQLFLADSAPFEEWALLRRERLRLQVQAALNHLVSYHEGRGDWDQVRRYAQRQLDLDAWREEAYRPLMRALAATGQRSAALASYHALCQVLEQKLGISPTPTTIALYERILSADDVKGLFPSPSEPALPPRATSLVGRQRELAHLLDLLDRADGRLVTLAGPGGVGKTRLALEAAYEQAAAFEHGACFVSLAPLSSPDFLVSAIIEALPMTLLPQAEPRQQLLRYLRARELLLVLDNFEHLLAGARLVAELLQAAPGLSILVTSRERLKLAQEWVVDLAGLATEAGDTDAPEAVALFHQQAQRVRSGWQAQPEEASCVVDICRLVEGFPLAIELAAAWLRSLTCAEIAAELEQNMALLSAAQRPGDPHQASLQTVFDRSWRLLTDGEQRALAWLSVFRGGFDRETAAAVADATLSLLSGLVEKSLIWQEADGRYSLHELLRHYAATRLETLAQTKAAHQAHLAFYVALAEEAAANLEGPQQRSWLDRLESERHNLRQALRWALEQRDITLAARLTGSLGRFWLDRGYLSEGIHWLNQVLAQETATTAQAYTGRCQKALGTLYRLRGDYATALVWLEQARTSFATQGDRAGLAQTLNQIGIVLSDQGQGQYDSARDTVETALALAQSVGDRLTQAAALTALGRIEATIQPGSARARALYEKSLSLSRELGNDLGVAGTLSKLGVLSVIREEFIEGRAFLEESLALYREIGSKTWTPWPLLILAVAATAQGDAVAAQAFHADSAALHQEVGIQPRAFWVLHELGLTALLRGSYVAARAFYEESLAVNREMGSHWGVALALAGLGFVCEALAEDGPANAYYEQATAVLQETANDLQVTKALPDVYEWLQAQAARLPTEEMRQKYLAIPAHRKIVAICQHQLRPPVSITAVTPITR
jgi:predicted ATPase/DNA-binding SARP family transcriptional activator